MKKIGLIVIISLIVLVAGDAPFAEAQNPIAEQMKVYVGNLSFQTSSETLRELFLQSGPVESAEVGEDKETGRSRGFGFVVMASCEEGEAAINQFNGTGYSDLCAIFQDSVTRWEPVSTSNMSFGRMTMYENRNSKKITWRSGQSSAYETISEDEDGTIIRLLSAPNFDGDRCRYIKMVFNEDSVTVDFYTTKSALDQNKFFMEGTYEQVK